MAIVLAAACSSGSSNGSSNHKLSGSVSGAVQSGVVIGLTGAATGSATTDSSGAFSFTLADGDYTLAPSKAGYTFDPDSRAVTLSGADVSGVSFVATAVTVTHSISGTVSGAVTAGVTVSALGPSSGSAVTDSGGAFTIAGLADGSYSVSPSLSGYVFTPSSQAVTVSGADVTGVSFTAAGVVIGGVHITDDITVPTTWTSSNTYVVMNDIEVSSTLTIQPGTVVKFDHGVRITVSGAIHADAGSAATPIVFTSLRDDAHAGDTNGDGPSAAPSGDWAGIELAASGSIFNDCQFLYGGASDYPALWVSDDTMSVTVKNTVFAHHRGPTDDISGVAALDLSIAAAGTVVTGNLFYDDRIPVAVNATFNIDNSNSFDNSAAMPASPMPSKYNAMMVNGCGEVQANISWAQVKVPMVIGTHENACSWVRVDSGAHLTLAPGVVIKFFPGGRLEVQGVLTANGTGTAPISFTSVRDDSLGGDTDADPIGASAADWQGIRLSNSGSLFNHAQFFYGSGDDFPALLMDDDTSSVTVTNSVFGHDLSPVNSLAAAAALDVSDAAAGTVVTGNLFFDNRIPLAINTTFNLDDSNAFVKASEPAGHQGNVFNGVVVHGCGEIDSAISWAQNDVPFIIGYSSGACDWVRVDSGGSLALGTGVMMKFHKDGHFDVMSGGSVAHDATDRFTSINDDTVGGDTNADSGAQAPLITDWAG
ncbi:MAG TPA: carboxypeptidase-like regulatory domain-containing protein, partial [Myxococcales bacterium]|nr:carboxypeptidase-like regulatory domain-containing protein [Myxococcales bacterium]